MRIGCGSRRRRASTSSSRWPASARASSPAIFDFTIQAATVVAAGLLLGVIGGDGDEGRYAVAVVHDRLLPRLLRLRRAVRGPLAWAARPASAGPGCASSAPAAAPVTFIPSCVRNVMRLVDILPVPLRDRDDRRSSPPAGTSGSATSPPAPWSCASAPAPTTPNPLPLPPSGPPTAGTSAPSRRRTSPPSASSSSAAESLSRRPPRPARARARRAPAAARRRRAARASGGGLPRAPLRHEDVKRA